MTNLAYLRIRASINRNWVSASAEVLSATTSAWLSWSDIGFPPTVSDYHIKTACAVVSSFQDVGSVVAVLAINAAYIRQPFHRRRGFRRVTQLGTDDSGRVCLTDLQEYACMEGRAPHDLLTPPLLLLMAILTVTILLPKRLSWSTGFRIIGDLGDVLPQNAYLCSTLTITNSSYDRSWLYLTRRGVDTSSLAPYYVPPVVTPTYSSIHL